MSNFKGNKMRFDRHKEQCQFQIGDRVSCLCPGVQGEHETRLDFGEGTVVAVVSAWMVKVRLDKEPVTDTLWGNPAALLTAWITKIEN